MFVEDGLDGIVLGVCFVLFVFLGFFVVSAAAASSTTTPSATAAVTVTVLLHGSVVASTICNIVSVMAFALLATRDLIVVSAVANAVDDPAQRQVARGAPPDVDTGLFPTHHLECERERTLLIDGGDAR